MPWTQLAVTVLGGVTVAVVTTLVRAGWTRRRVPAGMSRQVGRRSYLATVLAMSRRPGIDRLEAIVPNLAPAGKRETLRAIQAAWAGINGRRWARFVTGDSQDNLTAGAELLSMGMQVRVERSLGNSDLSYHIFGGEASHVVVNHRHRGRDRPGRFDGLSPAKIFHRHFDDVWQAAVPLESVLAEQVLTELGGEPDPEELAEQVRDLRARYLLDPAAAEAVLRHVAFLHAAPVIFITGLPGAGKSRVRGRLADRLRELRFHVDERSDYVYAFCDFLRNMILLDDGRTGFSPDAGGAFQVNDERILEPALHSLAQQVWANTRRTPITLVEFARSDMIAALRVFGEDVLSRAQIIYVRASAPLRAVRLEARAQPPRTQVSSAAVTVLVSDNHRLPSSAANLIYAADNFASLAAERTLDGRVYQLENELDDPAFVKLDEKLDSFVEKIVRPYRTLVA